jgi:hypothetical protein
MTIYKWKPKKPASPKQVVQRKLFQITGQVGSALSLLEHSVLPIAKRSYPYAVEDLNQAILHLSSIRSVIEREWKKLRKEKKDGTLEV